MSAPDIYTQFFKLVGTTGWIVFVAWLVAVK